MTILLELALALTAAAAPAPPPRWNPKAPENAQLLPAFSHAAVEPVLAAIGARYQRTGAGSAAPGFNVTFANGRKAVIAMSSCNPAGTACTALSVQANWIRPPDAQAAAVAEGITRFNQRYAFGKAFATADGRPGIQRYLTADYGFVRGNLAVNLLVFATQVDRFGREVLGAE